MVSRRQERVASLVRAELSRVLIEEIADDSMVGLSVNEVQMSGDLKQARVFLGGCFEGKAARAIEDRITEALPVFRRNLAHNLDLRFVPHIQFEWDKHTNEVEKIFSLLDSVRNEKRE